MSDMPSAAPREPIQLTVIGGFLGAGKTTLLNRLLRDAGDRRLAVLVNDFGAINVDAELVEAQAGEMVTLTNGCICCSVGGDFIGELALLRERRDPPRHVVVEASGVADPGAIVALGGLPGYRKDAAVVVVDAETVRDNAAHEVIGHQIVGQLRAADLLVLNKTDLVDAERLAGTRAWLRELCGPSTAIIDAAFGEVPVDVVLGSDTGARAGGPTGVRSTSHSRGADGGGEHVAPARGPNDAHEGHEGHDHGGEAHDAHERHPSFQTWSWTSPHPVSGAGLVEALEALPDGIVRAKGFLHLREDAATRYVLQVVGRRYSIEADRAWGAQQPASRIVVIGLPGTIDEHALDATLARLSAPAAAV